MKAVVAAFNQEKALLGALSVITNPRMELFEALVLQCNENVMGDRDGAAHSSQPGWRPVATQELRFGRPTRLVDHSKVKHFKLQPLPQFSRSVLNATNTSI